MPIPWGAWLVPLHPLGEVPFPDVQPDPPLAQLHAVSLGSVPDHREQRSVLPLRCGEVSLNAVCTRKIAESSPLFLHLILHKLCSETTEQC